MKNENLKTVKEYKEWLRSKLNQCGINRNKLVCIVIVIERAVATELHRIGSVRHKPFYKLFNDDGTETRAWIYAAELALYLHHNKYKADSYVRATLNNPLIQNRVRDKGNKDQLPFSFLFPVTRKNTDRMKKYSIHHRNWMLKND